MERLLDGFYTLTIKPCMTCLAGWRRKKAFVLTFGTGGYGRASARVRISKLPQMHGFSAEQLRNATHLVWAREVEWCRKKRWSNIWQKAANNFQCSIAILSLGERCCRWRSLRFYRLTCYSSLFLPSPNTFAVNGGFANQTNTVSKIKAIPPYGKSHLQKLKVTAELFHYNFIKNPWKRTIIFIHNLWR